MTTLCQPWRMMTMSTTLIVLTIEHTTVSVIDCANNGQPQGLIVLTMDNHSD